MFLNYSNHPSAQWSAEQRAAAEKWGQIQDCPFPPVPADYDEAMLEQLAGREFGRIAALKPDAVMCQGEFTLVYALVTRLNRAGIPALAACSQRVTEERISETGETTRISTFRFLRFRRYEGGDA